MKWSNLKINKCPQCDKPIASIHFYPREIVKHPCGFTIRVKRWSEILNSQITTELEERLNNELKGGE